MSLFLLAFLGITLLYTAFLVAAANHMVTGLALAFAGFVLLLKPTLEAARLLRGQSFNPPRPRGPNRKTRTKKVYLKIVKSEDEKPTIH